MSAISSMSIDIWVESMRLTPLLLSSLTTLGCWLGKQWTRPPRCDTAVFPMLDIPLQSHRGILVTFLSFNSFPKRVERRELGEAEQGGMYWTRTNKIGKQWKKLLPRQNMYAPPDFLAGADNVAES